MKSRLLQIAKRLISLNARGRVGDRTLDLAGITLIINQSDRGGQQYESRSSVEEICNQLYPHLAQQLHPTVVVDVGANYGFTAAVFARHFPDAELLLIEPDPKLSHYIRVNMRANAILHYRLIQAVCGDKHGGTTAFGVNPGSSQDNRVHSLPGWRSVQAPTITLSQVLSPYHDASVFIKVDTQGFETQVFKGAEAYLMRSNQWFIKSEFAPNWLESQGNSPEALLANLIENYLVVEAPARTRFCGDSLQSLFASPVHTNDIRPFVAHVKSLNLSGLGWVDLYIAPKKANYLYQSTCSSA